MVGYFWKTQTGRMGAGRADCGGRRTWPKGEADGRTAHRMEADERTSG